MSKAEFIRKYEVVIYPTLGGRVVAFSRKNKLDAVGNDEASAILALAKRIGYSLSQEENH